MWRFVVVMLAASCAAPLVQVSASKPKGFCGHSVVVIGAVAAPGKFDVHEAPTLLQAISRAGGFTPEAHTESVVIERCAGEKWEELKVAAGRAERGSEGDPVLLDGDIVRVETFD